LQLEIYDTGRINDDKQSLINLRMLIAQGEDLAKRLLSEDPDFLNFCILRIKETVAKKLRTDLNQIQLTNEQLKEKVETYIIKQKAD